MGGLRGGKKKTRMFLQICREVQGERTCFVIIKTMMEIKITNVREKKT